VIWPHQTYYTTKDLVTGRYKAHQLKGEEVAHVEQVRMPRLMHQTHMQTIRPAPA